MVRTSLFVFALTALLASVALGQGSFDVIVTYEGAPKRGTVTEMSKDTVGLEVSGGVVSKVELNNIRRVTFSDSPPALTSAITSISNGELEDALEKLGTVKEDNVPRDIVWQDVQYYKAYCMSKIALAGGGEKEKNFAGKAMGQFASNEGSYHYYEANEIMGDLASALGKPDVAATFYGKVSSAPWPEYKLKAAVLEGQALAAQGNFKDAHQRFQQAASSNLNTPLGTRMKELATLGRAVCLSEAGKPDEAVAEVEKIIGNGDSKDGELFARAYNALGYCHLKAKRPKDALLAYLHTDLMFYQDPTQHAEALYYLRGLWKDIDKTEQSLKARNLLKQRYPGSVWASKAE